MRTPSLPLLENLASESPLELQATARVTRTGSCITVVYTLCGSINDISWPDSADQIFTDGLWQGTCFEAFVALPTESGYIEINATSSGAWAAYSFSDYRVKVSNLTKTKVLLSRAECSAQEVMVRCIFDLSTLPNYALATRLDFGITMVIKSLIGKCHYFALAHPGPMPDFHDRRGFMLSLPFSQVEE